MDITFILCDPKLDLCNEWKMNIEQNFETPEERSKFCVVHGYLQNISTTFDCIVSPANSYARLDGAFDLVISMMFAPDDEDAVTTHCQTYLHAIMNGYQMPGTSLLIPMHPFINNRNHCKYIAHCPTMRKPGNCRWNKEVVYNCMWNLLCELRRHNTCTNDPIKRVFITGLGTGIGNFPSEICASQMILAYKHFVRNLTKVSPKTSWEMILDDSLYIEKTYQNCHKHLETLTPKLRIELEDSNRRGF